MTSRVRERLARLRRDTLALYLACRDPRVPWYAKAVAASVVAYALSPIDLVPDVIPVLGHLDDLVIVPLGVALAVSLVPRDLSDELRVEAERRFASGGPQSRVGALIVVATWVAVLVVGWLVMRR